MLQLLEQKRRMVKQLLYVINLSLRLFLREGKSEVATNFADKSYEEANYIMRTKKLLELADTYIIFNDGTGTVSEFAIAWRLARL